VAEHVEVLIRFPADITTLCAITNALIALPGCTDLTFESIPDVHGGSSAMLIRIPLIAPDDGYLDESYTWPAQGFPLLPEPTNAHIHLLTTRKDT
jgi:hypothetical protein